MLQLPGWRGLKAPPKIGSKWSAIKDFRVSGIKGAPRSMTDIHEYCKKIRYVSDGLGKDHWQTPGETLARGCGDCEDIAILARALFINAGWNDDDLELLLVRDLVTKEDHALLFVKDFFLDNRSPKPLHISRFRDMRPILGYRGNSQYLYGSVTT